MTIPNILTIARLCLVPVFIAVFILEGQPKTLSGLIFILASATDVLDGYIARKFNQTSKTGQLLDPLADKLMQITVVVSMLFAKMVPTWFVLVLAIKEVLMICGGIFLYIRKTFVKSNIFGKTNTVIVFCAMVILLMFSEGNETLKDVMLGMALGTNIAAIVSYAYLYFLQQKKFKKYIGKQDDKGVAE